MTEAKVRRLMRELDKRLKIQIAREREIYKFFASVYRARRREAKL